MLFSLIRNGGGIIEAVFYILSSLVVIFLTLPIHEFSHGFVASKLGDPTPKYQGRLTLNPLAHIDYIGALAILIFGFGWAKPVNVDMRYFKKPKRDMALTALAGPVSNILLAFIFILLRNTVFLLIKNLTVQYYIIIVCSFIAQINISLAVFNLIPIPPLDGSRLLNVILPDRIYYKIMRYERYLIYIVFALVFFGFLDRPMNFMIGGIYNGLSNLSNLIFGV